MTPFMQLTVLNCLQEHGWVMRGDDKDPRVAAGAADAFKGALDFFRAHLGGQ